MFQSARIKLTGLYLLIIMFVSVIFSLVIYSGINRELSRIEHFHQIRQEEEREGFNSAFDHFRQDLERRGFSVPPPPQNFLSPIDPQLIPQTRFRLVSILILVNLGILVAAGFLGYFLAGKTLLPIKEMTDEQKRFVTDASHELKTPLTSLRSEIEVNLRDKKLTLKDAKKILESNLEEVKKLQTLSDGLIKLTQFGEDNYIKFEEVSLASIIDESIKKVAGFAKQKNIAIDNKIENYLFEGSDRQTLSELFAIFLDNAIKYSPEQASVSLTSKKTDGHILIDITDQGAGIAKEDIPRIFERFYRAGKARAKADSPGYGLGLSIAKQIVEKHHGLINVASEIGIGTTFTVRLPIKHPKKII